jgi:hypothetical protein
VPLDLRQAWVLLAAGSRELVWGLRGVSRELTRWRVRASSIPDLVLRSDALEAIDRKRGNIYGASLFWILPTRRSPELLRLLVAYEIMADFLDCVSERGAYVGIGNGLQLHRALIEALDISMSSSVHAVSVAAGCRRMSPRGLCSCARATTRRCLRSTMSRTPAAEMRR